MSQNSYMTVVGSLKWFNAHKGYGFLVVPGIGDVMIHSARIKEKFDVWATPKNSIKMRVKIEKGEKGWQVSELIDPKVQ